MERTVYRLFRFNHAFQQWAKKRFTVSGLCLLGGIVTFGIVGLDIKRSLAYQVLTFLVALLVVAIAASYFIRIRLSARRRLPRFGTVGIPLRYRVILHNATRRRLPGLTLTETFASAFPNFPDFQKIVRNAKTPKARSKAWKRYVSYRRWTFAPPVALPLVAANGETEVEAEIIPLRRGVLRFQDMTLACPEPLGLVNRCLTLSVPESVLILPKRYQLPNIEMPGARRHQAGGLALAASVGDSEEFRALREYRPGDSPRKIHWKSWAKTGRPIIKEEQAEYSVRYGLILDTFQAEAFSKVMEEAVAIAASLACSIQTQDSLLDVVFVGLQAHSFTVGRGLGHTERLLELLASVVPCQDKPFDSLLPVVQEKLSMLSGCICVFLDWDSDRQALVEQLQAAGVPTLALIIAGEKGLTAEPDMSCLRDRQSSLHTLHLGKIQEGLWAL